MTTTAKALRIETLTNIIVALPQFAKPSRSDWASYAKVSLSTAKRDLAVAAPLAAELIAKAEAEREAAASARRAKGTGRPLVAAYLAETPDTIAGISAALGVHPRTVRAAILYGKGEGTFKVVGMGGSKGTAKIWALNA